MKDTINQAVEFLALVWIAFLVTSDLLLAFGAVGLGYWGSQAYYRRHLN